MSHIEDILEIFVEVQELGTKRDREWYESGGFTVWDHGERLAQFRERYASDPSYREQRLVQMRAYKAANEDRIREQKRRKYAENQEQILATLRERKKDPAFRAKLAEYSASGYKRDRARMAEDHVYCHYVRARQRAAYHRRQAAKKAAK